MPFTIAKAGVKVVDMFDLIFDRDQMNGKSIRYLILPLTVGSKLRPHLTSSLTQTKCIGKAMTYLMHI